MSLSDRIAALSLAPIPDEAHVLDDDRVLGRTKRYVIMYGPFSTVPNLGAEIIFVGLTPGRQQLELANRSAREYSGFTPAEYASAMRRKVAFAGSMRRNLVSMLDELGLQDHLHLESTAQLFEEQSERIFATSALRYPVFHKGKNYSGSNAVTREPLFIEMLDTLLAPMLAAMPNALVVPLGKWASAGVLHVANRGIVDRSRILLGFPHPSGANGHRKPMFARAAPQMKEQLQEWFSSRDLLKR